MQCQKCGKEIPEGRQFCVECDAMLAGAVNSAPQVPQPNSFVPPAAPNPAQANPAVPPIPETSSGFQAQPQAAQAQPQPAAPGAVDPNQSNAYVPNAGDPNQVGAYVAPSMGPSASSKQNVIKGVVAFVVAMATYFGIQWFQGEQKWNTFKKNYSSTCETGATKVGATQGQAETYCGCTLDEMQKKYSRNELYKFDEQITKGESVPDELMPIVTDCASKIK